MHIQATTALIWGNCQITVKYPRQNSQIPSSVGAVLEVAFLHSFICTRFILFYITHASVQETSTQIFNKTRFVARQHYRSTRPAAFFRLHCEHRIRPEPRESASLPRSRVPPSFSKRAPAQASPMRKSNNVFTIEQENLPSHVIFEFRLLVAVCHQRKLVAVCRHVMCGVF